MKYALLDENGNQIQWNNDDTVFELPPNAVFLSEEDWENRFTNIKLSTADKINNTKRDLISTRSGYLARTQNAAIEFLLESFEYPNKEKRQLAKQEIEEISTANTLTALKEFSKEFN